MNLDFNAHPLFSWYVVLLIISGAAMLLRGALNVGSVKLIWRVINLLVGLGFIGYGIYLGFIFKAGSYHVFVTAFILPIVLIVNTLRSRAARRPAKA